MDNNDKAGLLAGYFQGTLSPGQQEEVEDWIRSSEDNRMLARRACRLEQYITQYSISENSDGAAILKKAEANTAGDRWRKTRRRVARALGNVAAAALMLSLGYFVSSDKETFIKVNTRNGEVASYTLPDQTKVWLNTNSTLLYPESFSKGKRRVRLEGEAFFDVTKDEGHPFVVSARDCEIEVLGTQFDVSAYPDSPEFQATLVSGSIRFTDKTGRGRRPTELFPGQRLSLDFSAGGTTVSYVDTESLTSWRTGEINFNHIPLSDVLTIIGNNFGIRFVISGDKILDDTYTGSFSGQPLDEVLSTLEEVASIHFKPLEINDEDEYQRYIVY
ncbi:MAG: FecR domain-containing protein [Bacteroidales bacterium]|nr:FecR domain-containing protein [Bacteroidales bacterium]